MLRKYGMLRIRQVIQMETVEVVIRIPKRTYDRVSERGIIAFGDDAYYIGHAIKNGTVLPKGHGRLGDLDSLYEDVTNGIKAGNYEEGYEGYENINDMDDIVDAIKYAPTIIEADKEV